ncbi:hypothetical protein [Prosthecobacter sp.]|uniref:hypothetical protein n=1 Tax=Prosthecobacter sp. TaxID=1965333 RepID=UPI003782D3CE
MKTPDPLTIAAQMKVLQSREDVATWALAHLGLPPEWRDTNEEGNTERCQEAVNRVFTLTRKDIEDSLAAQGLQPENLPPVSTEVGSRDGSYFISKRRGEWEFYYQERGFPYVSATFDDLAEARKLLINYFIPVWLDHLHVPCRTKEGKMIKEL